MKICFYANHPKWGGLANNGGTRTILKSMEELDKQGHKTCIVSKVDRFTYFNHKKPAKSVPPCFDHYIAVSILDLKDMLKHVPANKASVWIRGHETWRGSYKEMRRIINKASIAGARIFVNSLRLQQIYGGIILYPGYDQIWHQQHRSFNKIRIGVLKHEKPSKGYSFFKKVRRELDDRYDYIKAGVNAVGDVGMSGLYHRCDIWFAPTNCEGLHCPPMEAALCGNLIVCSDHPDNGMVPDYATNETAMVYNYGDVSSAVAAIRNADFWKVTKMIPKIQRDIGTRERNMKKLIKLIGG